LVAAALADADLTAPLLRGMSALRTAAVADDVYMMIVYFADDVRRRRSAEQDGDEKLKGKS
jgi:hypothetical protein